jgi:thymidylate synthase
MKFKTTHEAYLQALKDVWFEPEVKSAPRGLPVREILNYVFTVTQPTSEPILTKDLERNTVIAAYTAKEKALYDSCSNKVEDFAKASKFWNQLANPDGTVNSAYGYLIWANKSHGNDFEKALEESTAYGDGPGKVYHMAPVRRTPWEWAKESLLKDKDTRQAILRFSLPEHQWFGNKDQTCTMNGIFLIRNDKLYLTITMRSNDLMKGLVYDLPWFISLMDRMVDELKPTYPNLVKGEYTHIVHSLHIYEKDKESILKMLGQQHG